MDHEFVRKDRQDYIGVTREAPQWSYLFDVTKHENSHSFLPYNIFSILHINDTLYRRARYEFTFDAKDFLKEENRFETALLWGPNSLHPLDMVRVNRVYQCGEHFVACKDQLSESECDTQGLGGHYDAQKKRRLHYGEHARCAERHPSFDKCNRTCGFCYKLYSEESRRFKYTNSMMSRRPVPKAYWRTCFVRDDFLPPPPMFDNFDPNTM
uniref:Peptidase M12A domain-containing protein n=1 Tax=Romanomermis culicivorax TaxID=13658 RepID=A0A915L8X8_ROMCU